MGHRINERNSGGWTLDGEPKTRRKSQKLTQEEEEITALVIERVVDRMEYAPELSDGHGQHHPDATFRDNGDFVIAMSRADYDMLYNAMLKLQKRYK